MTQSNSVSPEKSWFILALILALGLGLRMYKLDAYSIFFDEKSTMVISQGIVLEGANQKDVFASKRITARPFWQSPRLDYRPRGVLRSFTYQEIFVPKSFTPEEFWAPKSIADYYEAMTRSDIGNSPFYYLLLHYWLEIFGMSDFSARGFSVLFSIGIIALTYFFGQRFFSNKVGLIAAGIVAIEPFFIAYSHQARNYSLTFFLTLLATYYFLQIIEDSPGSRKVWKLYLGYILAAGLALLSHFLVITVLLAHGLYALFFLKNIKTWIRLALAAPAALSGVTWWLVAGGGQYTLYTLSYQADLYRRMAETRPYNNPFGALPATFQNVLNKSLPLFSDIFLFSNGLADALVGKRNLVVSLVLGLLLILWYRYQNRRSNLSTPTPALHWTRAVPFILMFLGLAIYTQNKIQFTILSVSLFALSLVWDVHKNSSKPQKHRLWLLYFMGLIPTLFLIVMAFKNGHTTGITQRYSGFSFPYVIILLSLIILTITKLRLEYRILCLVVFGLQMIFVGQRLKEFYQDQSVKYGYFANTREPNPYMEAAQRIQNLYQPGDTVLYPAPDFLFLSEMDRTFLPYSVQDAQLTNLYLPKKSQYVQRMDTTQEESILLLKKNQAEPIVIKRLKGLRYGSE
ncbi:glycosyltransferase family 39 protein [Dyadobacter tibetensis]|uniref:glycosyltransferase family 39 protein n=1 Tax=Dyadobacter tibetensis TaxID=1211851 RepID=UPI0004715AA5|nr:glycosyltransferase family 39 protein [Dyadobacter tibetensis]